MRSRLARDRFGHDLAVRLSCSDAAHRHSLLDPAILVHNFAVEVDVQTFAFDIMFDAEPDDQVNHFEDDERDNRTIHDRHADPVKLGHDLTAVAVDQAAFGFDTADARFRKHTGQNRTDDAADAVNAEGVKAVVVTEGVFQARGADVAGDTGNEADDQRTHRIDKARGGGDGDEASNRTRDDAENARFALQSPFGEHPGQTSSSRGHLRYGHGHTRGAVCGDSGAGVEAEPADPQESGTDEAQNEVMRRESFRAVTNALAEDESANQASNACVDVHDRTAGEIKHACADEEAAGTSDPVSDRGVH